MAKIPTQVRFGQMPWAYDYGEEVNKKLVSLGWSASQYDFFLDWMHQEKPIDELVALVLFYAPNSWLQSEADAIGVFDREEETQD